MTRKEFIQIFIDRVLKWDHENILELADLLYDLDHSIRFEWNAGMDRWEPTGENITDYLDPEELPSRLVPKHVAANNRIWAMDKKGNCLVHMDFDSTNHGHFFSHMIRHIDQF